MSNDLLDRAAEIVKKATPEKQARLEEFFRGMDDVGLLGLTWNLWKEGKTEEEIRVACLKDMEENGYYGRRWDNER